MLRGTWEIHYHALLMFTFTGLSPSPVARSKAVHVHQLHNSTDISCQLHIPTSPILQRLIAYTAWVFGFSRFAHHYSGNHFVFFSSHYLDVSVHAVRLSTLCIQIEISRVCLDELPHSETLGSKLYWQLPEAYSSLTLPSSPLDTMASTKCPFQLSTNFSSLS